MFITKKNITPEEYLDLERKAEYKSEYDNGEMFPRAVISRGHNLISGNMIVFLHSKLLDSPCQFFHSDLKIYVPERKYFTYPDIIVVCGEQNYLDDELDTLLNPTLIVEILSDSTEAYDRGKKFEYYRQIESLKEYVLVSQNHIKVENFVKQSNGKWLLDEEGDLEKSIELLTINCSLPLKEVYRGIVLVRGEKNNF